MQVPLRPFLFFALLTTGACFECETCTATGTNCTGGKHPCRDDEVTCIVAIIEIVQDGKSQQTVVKGCESAKICDTREVKMTVGNKTSYRAGIVCCHGDDCQKATPKLPPIQNEPNGLTCPGCFTTEMVCSKETLKCTGSENVCIDMTASLSYGGKETNRIIMGCTTSSVCSAITNGRSPLLDYESVKYHNCYQSSGFRSTGFLLPLFSELLLLKILL